MKKQLDATSNVNLDFLYVAFTCLVFVVVAFISTSIVSAQAEEKAADPADRQVFFGETHLHTVLSFDAYIFGNRNGPDEAYRYAKGEAINHPAGFEMKLQTPLDFQAVTDHAIYLGMLPAMHDPKQAVSRHPISLEMRKAKTPTERLGAFQKLFPLLNADREDDLVDELYSHIPHPERQLLALAHSMIIRGIMTEEDLAQHLKVVEKRLNAA